MSFIIDPSLVRIPWEEIKLDDFIGNWAEAEKHSLEPLRARTYYKLERKKKKNVVTEKKNASTVECFLPFFFFFLPLVVSLPCNNIYESSQLAQIWLRSKPGNDLKALISIEFLTVGHAIKCSLRFYFLLTAFFSVCICIC